MKVIDLSVSLYTNMEVFPGDPEVKINVIHTHENNSWELRNITMGSHTGTHVDSFSHMHKNKETLDEITIERFFGRAQVVELCEPWPKDTGLFFIEEIGIKDLNRIIDLNPGFVGGNITEDLERELLRNDIITYTGLVNLKLIPRGKTFVFFGLPLKIKSGDGSPVRAIAIVKEM
ncbi:MAG TPA: cyclase [Clostridium sp.]|nr:cyclase [Clostridium sp.]